MNKTTKEIMGVLRGYATLKQSLNSIAMVTSPSFDAVNVPCHANHSENKFVRHADISFQIHKIEQAIDELDSKERFIILKYIIDKEYTQKEMCQRYNVSKSGFNYQKNQALTNFAKNYGLNCCSDDTKKELAYN